MTSICLQDMLANYIERLMNKCLDELIRSGCIELKEAQQAPQGLVKPWVKLSNLICKSWICYIQIHWKIPSGKLT